MTHREALANLRAAREAKAAVEWEAFVLRALGRKVKPLRRRRKAAWLAVTEARRVLDESDA